MKSKKCIICGEMFIPTNSVQKYCSKECVKIRRKEYREKNKEKIANQQKEYNAENKEKIIEYRRQYSIDNKDKINEYGKKYREENREEIKEKDKKYYKKNKEKILADNKKWQENNRDKMRGYCRKYEADDKNKEKRKEYKNRPEVRKRTRERNRKYDDKRRKDPIFRFNQNMSRSISLSLKKNNLSKNGRHWEDLVGYTSQELRDHLESLFLPGMTWENRSLWHIDHIIPKSFFQIKEVGDVEFRMCWRLENLQPLWAFDNISKHNKIIKEMM